MMEMRIGRSPFIAAFMLTQVYSACGFVGGLKKLKPKNIVKAVKDNAPQAAETLKERSPSSLVSDAISNNDKLQDATKSIADKKDKALETVKGASSAASTAIGGGVAYDSKETTVTITSTTLKYTTTDEDDDEDESIHLDGPVDANALARAQAELEKVQQQLKDREKDIEVKVPTLKEAEDVLRENIEKSNPKLADVIKNGGAEKGLRWVKDAIQNNGKKLKDGASSLAESTPDSIATAVKRNTPKSIQDTVEDKTPDSITKVIEKASQRPDGNDEQDLSSVQRHRHRKNGADGETVAPNWRWSAVACLVAVCAVIATWQLVARIKGRDSRSPTLLVENDVQMFMAGGQRSQIQRGPGQEEPLFTQF